MKMEFENFYQKHLHEHGSSAQGVGWKNKEAQLIRFQQLFKIVNGTEYFSVNDLGCGVGDFFEFLHQHAHSFTYRGYDVINEMVNRAVAKLSTLSNGSFIHLKDAEEMLMADYTIASGIFNIRFNASDEQWLDYILSTLRTMNEKSKLGFAFNILTKYSDAEYMKDELYYADPLFLFDFCKKSFSKNVALLHDYNQYDFTILVRKNL